MRLDEKVFYSLLKDLVYSFGVTGDTAEVRALIKNWLAKKGFKPQELDYGMLYLGPKRPKVLIYSHIDEVGFQVVKHIGDNKFRILPVGALKAYDLINRVVEVKLGDKKVLGVVYPEISLRDDLGSSDFAKLVLMLNNEEDLDFDSLVGAYGTYKKEFFEESEFIFSSSVDNRISVAMALYLILNHSDLIDKGVGFAFGIDEEMEDHSATSLPYLIESKYAFVLDYCPVHQKDDENEVLNSSDDLPIVMYRGGSYLLHEELKNFFDGLYKQVKFVKGFLGGRTVHKLEPSNFEDSGRVKAVNLCIPAYGYHAGVYAIKKAIENFYSFLNKALEEILKL